MPGPVEREEPDVAELDRVIVVLQANGAVGAIVRLAVLVSGEELGNIHAVAPWPRMVREACMLPGEWVRAFFSIVTGLA